MQEIFISLFMQRPFVFPLAGQDVFGEGWHISVKMH